MPDRPFENALPDSRVTRHPKRHRAGREETWLRFLRAPSILAVDQHSVRWSVFDSAVVSALRPHDIRDRDATMRKSAVRCARIG